MSNPDFPLGFAGAAAGLRTGALEAGRRVCPERIEAAHKKGLIVVGLTGRTGGKMKAMCDHCLSIPSDSTPRIQEGHLASYHLICGLIEETMFGGAKSKY